MADNHSDSSEPSAHHDERLEASDHSNKNINFRLCGTYRDLKVPFHEVLQNGELHEGLQRALMEGFSLEFDADVHMHVDDEQCHFKRPLSDLKMLLSDDGKGFNDTFMIHPMRPCTPTGWISQQICSLNINFNAADKLDTSVMAHAPDRFWAEAHQVDLQLRSTTMEDLDSIIKQELVTKLENDDRLRELSAPDAVRFFSDKPDKFGRAPSRMDVRFRKGNIDSHPYNGTMNLSSNQTYIRRLRQVQDVYSDPHELVGYEVDLDVEVSIAHIKADPVYHIADLVHPPTAPTPPRYVRLGETRARDSGDYQADIVYALVARLDNNDKIQELLEMEGWELGEDDFVNDPEDATPVAFDKYRDQDEEEAKYAERKKKAKKEKKKGPVPEPEPGLLWDEPYRDCKSLAAVQAKIKAGTPVSDKLPKLPPMSFTYFNRLNDPAWGAGFTRGNLVMRLFCHLPNPGIDRREWNAPNYQIEVDTTDTAHDVEQNLHERLSSFADKTLRDVLYPGGVKGPWKGDLWIRPEKTGALHRFTGRVTRYVCPEEKNEGNFNKVNKMIYGEYHIWPKDAKLPEGL